MYYIKRDLNYGFNASTKAPYDVYRIISSKGAIPIYIKWDSRKKFKLILNLIKLRNKINRIACQEKMPTIVFEYPYGRRSNKILFNNIKFDKINSIAIVHDIPSLRKLENESKFSVSEDVFNLNNFKYVIVHNDVMKKWLIENGLKTKAVSLEIFDYLYDGDEINGNKNEVIFAGNLSKSVFLKKINPKNFKLNLFGNEFESTNENIQYFGSFHPDELIKNLKGGFGLVWDGDSINSCTGPIGKYLMYNNPHKTSLYIAAGLPIIIWKKAAMYNFISKNKIGIGVDSLEEIDTIIKNLSDEDYIQMVNNVRVIRDKLISGGYLLSALEKINRLE